MAAVPTKSCGACTPRSSTSCKPRVPAVRREQDLLDRTLKEFFPFAEDLALARIPDSQGLGEASGP